MIACDVSPVAMFLLLELVPLASAIEKNVVNRQNYSNQNVIHPKITFPIDPEASSTEVGIQRDISLVTQLK